MALGINRLVPANPRSAITKLVVARTTAPPSELTMETKKMSTKARKLLPASTVRLSRVACCVSS